MGTNYYWHEKEACPTCKREYEPLHIGKSSGGWHFALHVISEIGVNDLEDWLILWQKPGSYIIDEYGQEISFNEMKSIITERSWEVKSNWTPGKYHSNHAEPGLNGLARHVIGLGCVKHGAGTWDCIEGEFS